MLQLRSKTSGRVRVRVDGVKAGWSVRVKAGRTVSLTHRLPRAVARRRVLVVRVTDPAGRTQVLRLRR